MFYVLIDFILFAGIKSKYAERMFGSIPISPDKKRLSSVSTGRIRKGVNKRNVHVQYQYLPYSLLYPTHVAYTYRTCTCTWKVCKVDWVCLPVESGFLARVRVNAAFFSFE